MPKPQPIKTIARQHTAVKIPIIGMGGISNTRDALEFMIAGATAIQIGTASFIDPFIFNKLLKGLDEYMDRHKLASLSDLVGTIDTTAHEKQWISS